MLTESGARRTITAVERVPHAVVKRLRVAFAVGGLHTEGSGVARIVCDLANALLRRGVPVDVFTSDCAGRGADGRWLDSGNRLQSAPGRWWGRLAWSPALRRMLNDSVENFDIVHNHSLWMLPTSYATRAAVRRKVPVLFTAHGFLEPWALAHSRWKKRLAGWLFQNGDLRRAACIHVNSRSELESIRGYGLRNPVAIIPNGVDLEDFAKIPERQTFEQRCLAARGKRVCLFLSRLHSKKGLEHLIRAWSRVRREFGDWHLVIAGPDDGYEAHIRTQVASLDLERCVSLTGALYGAEKYAAYSAAELFVLPSFSEGFSMAVLEALAVGLPVLITPGCNFREAVEYGAGIEVQPNAEDTERGLRQFLASSPEVLAAMGTSGRQLIEASYTWDRVAESMLHLYQWMTRGGTQPDFVTTE